jgi:hypothetical protein
LISRENVAWSRPLKGAGGEHESDLGLILYGQLHRDPTAKQKRDAEQLLKLSEDYDPKLHAELGNTYEYNYKYYPGDRRFYEVFTGSRNTLIGIRSEPKRDIRAEWDTAIRITFGHLRNGDIPENGFYVLHRMSEQAATRVYRVLPTPPLNPDVWDGDDGPLFSTEDGLESRAPVCKSEIHVEIRRTAVEVRSKRVNEMTIRRNLAKLALHCSRQDIAHLRFYWSGDFAGGHLAWELGDTSEPSVLA